MEPPPSAEPPFKYVGKIEGIVDGGRFAGRYKLEPPPPGQGGEWEYIFVARIPPYDLAKTSSKLPVHFARERLRLDLEIDPDDPSSFDDLVILEGGDGSRQALGVVSQGKMHAHAKGMTTVIFEGVRVGAHYTCTVDPGRQGRPYKLFTNLELKPLHLLPKQA